MHLLYALYSLSRVLHHPLGTHIRTEIKILKRKKMSEKKVEVDKKEAVNDSERRTMMKQDLRQTVKTRMCGRCVHLLDPQEEDSKKKHPKDKTSYLI